MLVRVVDGQAVGVADSPRDGSQEGKYLHRAAGGKLSGVQERYLCAMKPGEEWKQADKAERWVSRRPRLPRQSEAERTIVENILPRHVARVLDLGTGDGHLLGLVRRSFPTARAVGIDLSEPMLAAARTQFAGTGDVEFRLHDLSEPLTGDLGTFDVVISGLAIHHLLNERKRSLFREVFDLLEPGGVFCNFDVVASPTPDLHERAQAAFGFGPEDHHPSDRPAPLQDQLIWLSEAGFSDVDCYWKWLELTVMAGAKGLREDSSSSAGRASAET
jgi:tRNA (cmo5U34)-methyltransferase